MYKGGNEPYEGAVGQVEDAEHARDATLGQRELDRLEFRRRSQAPSPLAAEAARYGVGADADNLVAAVILALLPCGWPMGSSRNGFTADGPPLTLASCGRARAALGDAPPRGRGLRDALSRGTAAAARRPQRSLIAAALFASSGWSKLTLFSDSIHERPRPHRRRTACLDS